MAEFIEFTNNYQDRSTERGFQWEFYCQRCNNGYRSAFQASATGLLSEALDVASGLFGGVMGNIANIGDRVHSAAWERAHDSAFTEAANEVHDFFIQCPNCNEWVCRKRCWNESRGLCLDCAPSANIAAAQAQATAIADQVRQQLSERTYDVSEYTQDAHQRAGCPTCGAALQAGAKFCPECGAAIKAARFCSQCGSELAANAKFCAECGAKQ